MESNNPIHEEFDEVMKDVDTSRLNQREWINVKDRLPPQNVYVLVAQFDHRPKVEMYFITIAERIGQYWYEGKDGDELTKNGKYGKVTHWISLPEPPKEIE